MDENLLGNQVLKGVPFNSLQFKLSQPTELNIT